ncbi:hypothetical protein BAE44_0008424 [Dichanthelium oligosanthes]|uniref:Bifunctional inhibitor/plant lipid transfer protein/seed storage helical domain-containing protein n=1 Tax=Dichanthelium oligosanthes TaxID=888268 RepID=A0A1E5VZM2_9POAL|nr:hypothetical protein BAE44_0008424 [Dichanthelium oligosanthes]
MTTKVIIQLLVIALVLTIFAMPQAWGEQDCHREKLQFLNKRKKSLKREGDYVRPDATCCHPARSVDMTCVCRSITPKEERKIDIHCAYWISLDCHNPVPNGNNCGSECLILFSFLNFFVVLVHYQVRDAKSILHTLI